MKFSIFIIISQILINNSSFAFASSGENREIVQQRMIQQERVETQKVLEKQHELIEELIKKFQKKQDFKEKDNETVKE